MNAFEVKQLSCLVVSLKDAATCLATCTKLEELKAEVAAILAEVPADAGGTGAGVWSGLDAETQKSLFEKLQDAKLRLDAHVASRRCADSGALMSERCVPTRWIVALVVVAALGTLLDLYAIRQQWKGATQGGAVAEERQAALEVSTEAAKTAKADTQRLRDDLSREKALAESPQAEETPAVKEIRKKLVTAEDREKEAWKAVIEVKGTTGPNGTDVLIMVVLLGALGGLLHMASSLTMYIGNRVLYRSWIVYYLLAPLQGGALALIMYLLVTSTVLQLPLGQTAGTAELNLTGVYGLSALSGLFAKQAIEKLKDVFSTFFGKVTAKDPVPPTT